MEVKEKKPIRPILRQMEIYDSEVFPIEYFASVHSAIQLLQMQRSVKFTTKRENELIKVTRVA